MLSTIERDPIGEDIKLIEQKHQQLEEKNSELEDRSRQNNLWFSGFTEKAEGAETWEESENKRICRRKPRNGKQRHNN